MLSVRSTPSAAAPANGALHPASLDAILNYAWGADDFTATDAIAATGLTRSTSIDAMETLTGLGLLEELPNAREVGDYRKGRPARRFRFNAETGVVIGVDAGHTHLTAIVADLLGRPLATVQSHSGRLPGSEHEVLESAESDRRDAITGIIETSLKSANTPDAELLAICVGVPAPVDARGRSPKHRTGFWQRINPDLIDMLTQLAPVASVENDASLAAVAEGTVGATQGSENFVALLAGSRMGAGVVVDGNLLRGAHGAAGEMGAFEHVVGVGNADGLGHYAERLAERELAGGQVSLNSTLSRIPKDELTGQVVLELAESGDADAGRIARHIGERLARIVSVLGAMYDPQKVVVSGAIGPSLGKVIEAARDALPTDIDSPAPEIVASSLGRDAVVTGAKEAAVNLARARALDLRLAERARR